MHDFGFCLAPPHMFLTVPIGRQCPLFEPEAYSHMCPYSALIGK